MSASSEGPAGTPEEERRELEDALRRGLRDRDELLREAAEAPPDAARTARNLAAFRAIAREASKNARPSELAPGQARRSRSRSPWKLLIAAAAAVFVVLVAKWMGGVPDRGPESNRGPAGPSMEVLGDPSGIHLDDAVLRWPAVDPRSVYLVQIVDPTGAVEAAVVEVLENHVPLPERFRNVPRFRVTVTSTSESGETRSHTVAFDRSP